MLFVGYRLSQACNPTMPPGNPNTMLLDSAGCVLSNRVSQVTTNSMHVLCQDRDLYKMITIYCRRASSSSKPVPSPFRSRLRTSICALRVVLRPCDIAISTEHWIMRKMLLTFRLEARQSRIGCSRCASRHPSSRSRHQQAPAPAP